MMSKYFTHILVPVSLVLLAIGFSACQEDDELPAITAEGKNTFGCLVNGELWLPKGRLGQGAAFIELQLPENKEVINLYVDDDKTNSGITISINDSPGLKTEKIYDLKDDAYYVEYSSNRNGKLCFYRQVLDGYIKLSKFNPGGNIISGTFEFKAYSDACNDTVTITEGRFDIGEITK